jgi:hypothetical protein
LEIGSCFCPGWPGLWSYFILLAVAGKTGGECHCAQPFLLRWGLTNLWPRTTFLLILNLSHRWDDRILGTFLSGFVGTEVWTRPHTCEPGTFTTWTILPALFLVKGFSR